ncbi:sulfite exporter TauE/SafE family protein [Candidatus Marinimicrobia bacterium]|nr:sulfite exporter TauE/SafE family protein [Candidatus Neomarinimicrobiota bacterium]|tara:strand:+ start:2680 stop:3354 length:675 start_codon:yes stop_codon:yes gene_type:complete
MADSLTFTSIFLLGCLHALEPGHGKTFLLAYTVGGKLDFQKIILLTLSLLVSHFLVLSIIAIIFNIILAEVASSFLHEFSHWIAPVIIISFGSYILGKAIYKMRHVHSNDCGHNHGDFGDSKIENPITVGLLTGILPCASSLAVVMMTGMTPSISSIIGFILIYVLGIALVLFLVVLTFNFAKNIIIEKFNNLKININQEVLSGCLILGVGFIYLTYNFLGHSH